MENKTMEELFLDYLGESWYIKLKGIINSPYFVVLGSTIQEDRKTNDVIPKETKLAFRAFKETPFEKVKVMILSQDPYHDIGRYDGLCFSNGNLIDGNGIMKKMSPSLETILNEVQEDVYGGFQLEQNPDLTRWAKQGVLLLNTALTVIAKNPGSHIGLWKQFTIHVLETLSKYNTGVIYLLWGAHASSYSQYINEKTNYILYAGHPSPLNTTNPFIGCKHFSQANKLLREMNGDDAGIKW